MRKTPQSRNFFLALLVLTLLLPIFSPHRARAFEFETTNEESRQIAILLPLSGPFADLGQALQKGFKLGFAEQMKSRQMSRQFKIRFLDSEGNPDTARTLIALLNSEDETVIAAGTPLNTTAWTASHTCEEHGLPYLIVGADQDNLINEDSIFTFRLTQPRAAANEILSDFINSQRPKIRSLGIIYGENPCAVREARRLRKFCANKNLDLAIWEVYHSNESNFYDLVKIIKKRRPQLLFLVTDPTASDKLWQQVRRSKRKPPITITMPVRCVPGTDKDTPLEPLINQIIYPTPWLEPTDPENRPHLENCLQAQGYAAAEIILKSLEKSSNLTSGEVVKTLEATTMTTVYGQVIFSGSGLGHQNPLYGYLCTYNADGTHQIVFPRSPSRKRVKAIKKKRRKER